MLQQFALRVFYLAITIHAAMFHPRMFECWKTSSWRTCQRYRLMKLHFKLHFRCLLVETKSDNSFQLIT